MFKKIISSFLALSLLLAPMVPTANATLPSSFVWNYVGTGGAGRCMLVVPDSSVVDRVYLISDYSSILKSTDGADNWGWLHDDTLTNNSGTSIVQAPSNSSVFYHQTGKENVNGQIHSSVNGGVTWTTNGSGNQFIADQDQIKSLAVNRIDANIAFLTNTLGDIYRTVNRITWAIWKTTAQMGIGKIWVNAIDKTNTYLWSGSPSGLRRTALADGVVTPFVLTGTNATYNTDIQIKTIAGVNYVFVTAGNRIAYTTDNGATWNYTADNGQGSGNRIEHFDVGIGASLATSKIMSFSHNIANFYLGNRFKSSNGGTTWVDATGTDNVNIVDVPSRDFWAAENYIQSITVDPNNTNRYWTTGFWGVRRTDDFGVSWNDKCKGLGIQFVTDVKIAPDNSIYASNYDNGLIRSVDGGLTWKQLMPNASQKGSNILGHCLRIAILGTQAQWLAGQGCVVATTHQWSVSPNQAIIRSTNQGGAISNVGTWSILTGVGIPNGALSNGISGFGLANGLVADPNNTSTTVGKLWLSVDGYSGTENGGIFVSTNAGQSWTRKSTNSSANADEWKIRRGIAVNPTDSNNILAGTFGAGLKGIRRSIDGGTTWTQVSGLNFCYDIKFSQDGTAYWVGDNGGPKLYKSIDKGATWTQIWAYIGLSSGPADGFEIDPSNPNRAAVSAFGYGGATPRHIFITENLTAASPTFTDVNGNLPANAGFCATAWRLNEGTGGALYGGTNGSGIWKMSLSSTGALTSTAVTPASFVASATGNVLLQATTQTDLPNNGKFKTTFTSSPGSGFSLGSVTVVSQTGIDGTLTASVAGNTLTLTRSGGTTFVGGAFTVTVSAITNPNTNGATGTFTMQTTNSTDVILDSDSSVPSVTITSPATPPVITGTAVVVGSAVIS